MTADGRGAGGAGDYRRRIFERYASAFKGNPGPAEAEARCRSHAAALDSMLGPWLAADRPSRVLEIGCGAGAFLWWARSRGIGEVAGVDLSGEMVAQARSLGLPAELGDARSSLAERRGLDWIVAFDLVEHFRRDEVFEVLELCRGALREGGRILLSTPNAAAWRPGPVAAGDLTHETIFTPSTIRLALELAGFRDVRVAEVPPPVHGPLSLARRVLWAAVRRIPWLIDRIETGGDGGGIYTRVMFVAAARGAEGGP
ncbi:MAG: class I SAM-dependent methyltransferase [Planctomycetaceae bacterium]|nr:class I SAM-dependent methyltransferase [Planctomycetota bacterium]NUN53446.1 class I SAM-dependent methyltransferase [Planctomycetaceae bacterium]